METTENFKSIQKFKNISSWSHELNFWAQTFKKRFGVFPNILVASEETYNRIDMVANTTSQNKITNDQGKHPDKFVKMTGFQGQDYKLFFCMDPSLETDKVKLIYDQGLGGDGEPILDSETVFVQVG